MACVIETLEDISSRNIKEDTLFFNLYDYWSLYHDPNRRYFWWYPRSLTEI